MEINRKETDFLNEVIITICPYCNNEIIYHRREDLGKFHQPIDRAEVNCFICSKKIAILGDTINRNCEKLYLDHFYLKKKKLFSLCIFILASSVEEFLIRACFEHLIINNLKQKMLPHDLDRLNLLIKNFYKIFSDSKMTIPNLKSIFFKFYLNKIEFFNENDVIEFLNIISDEISGKKLKCYTLLSNSKEIKSLYKELNINDERMKEVFLIIRDEKIQEIRNKVVHQRYIPTLKEVDNLGEKVRKVAFFLQYYKFKYLSREN
jgi:hypothetical protein